MVLPIILKENLIDMMTSLKSKEVGVFAVVDDIRSGKTTKLSEIIQALKSKGINVGGVLQPEENGVYYIEDVQTQKRIWLAKRSSELNQSKPAFVFNAEAFDFAYQTIIQARKNCDVLVVDELGRLEAKGQGHLPAVSFLIEAEQAKQHLYVIRKDVFSQIQSKLIKDISFLCV